MKSVELFCYSKRKSENSKKIKECKLLRKRVEEILDKLSHVKD